MNAYCYHVQTRNAIWRSCTHGAYETTFGGLFPHFQRHSRVDFVVLETGTAWRLLVPCIFTHMVLFVYASLSRSTVRASWKSNACKPLMPCVFIHMFLFVYACPSCSTVCVLVPTYIPLRIPLVRVLLLCGLISTAVRLSRVL